MKLITRSVLILAGMAAGLLFGLTDRSSAATAGLTSVTGPTVWPNTDNQDWSLGWEFQVTSPITVTALGYNNYGFSSSHDVGIFNAGGTLLSSAFVSGGSTLFNNYRYTGISPLSLGVGDYYISGTTLGLNDGWIYQATSFVTNPSITYLGSYFTSGDGGNLYFPDGFASDRQYLEVNFQLPGTATPLPSTWLMLLSGFVGLGFFAYRGTKKNAAAIAAA